MKPRIHTACGLAVAVSLATLAIACDNPELPMAPTELASGIVVYEHANYLGNSAHITGDVSDLRDFRGPCLHESSDANGNTSTSRDWNDCISSVRVAPGWRATLYRATGFRDDSLDVTADVPNLQLVRHDCDHDGLNDCVSSIRVRAQ